MSPPTINLPDEMRTQLTANGQEHIVRWFDGLGDNESREKLLQQLTSIDIAHVATAFRRATTPASPGHVASVEPLSPNAEFSVDDAPEVTESWHDRGMDLIKQGKLGILLMAGGQVAHASSLALPSFQLNMSPCRERASAPPTPRACLTSVCRRASRSTSCRLSASVVCKCLPTVQPFLLIFFFCGLTQSCRRQDSLVHHDQRGDARRDHPLL